MEAVVGIFMVLLVLGTSLFIAYWGLTSLWKQSKEVRGNENADLRKELADLKHRVEVLEKERI